MLRRARFVKRLVVDLPRKVRLAYCLVREPRVPMHTKAAFLAGIGLIVTPFVDLPAALPVIGEIDMLALSLLALRLFIAAAPADVVADCELAILEQRSSFDEDVRRGERLATALARRFRHESGDLAPHQPPLDVAEQSASEATHGVVA